MVPVELVLQDRSYAAWRPGAYSMRKFAETAFVYEDNDAAFCLGFFLTAGQICSFQSRIALSFAFRVPDPLGVDSSSPVSCAGSTTHGLRDISPGTVRE